MKRLCLCLLVPFSLFSFTEQEIKNRMYTDLETIKGIFETQYAPREWKEAYFGWNLEREIESAKAEVAQTPGITIKDYQVIVKKFFNSSQDHHVEAFFYSTESARLPFRIKSAEGRYFISAINRKKLGGCLLQVGDEVIRFDGRPIAEVMQEFQLAEFPKKSQPLAELSFTKREGSAGFKVPQGEVLLEVISKEEKETVYYRIEWNYTPEEIRTPSLGTPTHFTMAQGILKKPLKKQLNQDPIFKKSMLLPSYEMSKREEGFQAGEGLGDKKSFLPALGKKVWSSNPQSPFNAYLFETVEGQRFGYIRIPSYSGSSEEFKEFKDLIARFKDDSEALIIDQLNNPGGSLFYMYALASTLTDRPLEIPPHRMTITQKEIAFALDQLSSFDAIETDEEAFEEIGDEFDGLPVNLLTALNMGDYFRFLISQWNLGITFTSPYHLYGYDLLLPDPEVHYSKPILLLINHLDFSCADFFPCIMQDNQRATLLGTTTGGAGGFVLKTEYPNLLGIKRICYTGSIALRKDQQPIESVGVQPDITYELTVEDLTQFYAPFKEKILESVKKLTE